MSSHELGGPRVDSPLASHEGLVHVNYDEIDVPEWFVEPGIQHGYRPWQHTPLTPYDESVREHQTTLYNAFQRLATEPIPPEIAPEIAQLVHIDFMAGNARRQIQCQSNFSHWEETYPDQYAAFMANDELRWLLDEARRGHGSPAGLLKILASAPSLRSLDLQVLTTPYGYRRSNLSAMHEELVRDVEGIGGEILDTPMETHAPSIAVHVFTDENGKDNGHRGLIVTKKQLVGSYVPDTRPDDPIFIMERQAYVMRTDDEVGFSKEIRQLLRKISEKDPQYVKIQQYVNGRLGMQAGTIPTSTMVYAYRLPVKKIEELKSGESNLVVPRALGKTATTIS